MTARAPFLVVFASLIAFYPCAASPAGAVSPPPIDESHLPESAPPVPPQPTAQRELCTVPSTDPGLGDLDKSNQLAGLELPQIWQLTRGSNQRVAVIDTGVAPHRRLPDLVAGGDYVFTGDGTQDCDGHGTIVAGIIAARPDPKAADHFSGVAPQATVISIRQSSTKFGPVGDKSSSGFGDVDTMAKAVRTAADLGASVINISSVACMPVESALDDRALGAALAYAVDIKNTVVVAAAGNTGGARQCPAQPSQPTWDTVRVAVSPAWYDDYVLTVGSVNAQGAPSAFSLPGPWVDVAAPGEAVASLSPMGDGLVNSVATQGQPAASLSGTSYAAPVVSGVAALIRSRFPTLTARQVMQRIQATAHHSPGGRDPVVGNGVVDALAAVSTDTPPTTTTARPPEKPVAVPAPAVPPKPSGSPKTIAFTGATICVVVLAVSVIIGTAGARLRRFRTQPGPAGHDDIASD